MWLESLRLIPHISNLKKKRTVGWIVHGLSIVASFFRCPGHLEGDEQIRRSAHSYTSQVWLVDSGVVVAQALQT